MDAKVRIGKARLADVGEMLTLQRLAYTSEARIYRDPELPPLTETHSEMADAVRSAIVLKAVAGRRIVGAVRAFIDGLGCGL